MDGNLVEVQQQQQQQQQQHDNHESILFDDPTYEACLETFRNQTLQNPNNYYEYAATASTAVTIQKVSSSPIVQRWRSIVLCVLLISMLCTATAVYVYLSYHENQAFDDEFQAKANKVAESLGRSIELSLGSMDSMSVNIVSYAKYTNQTWPFVTIADYEVSATKIRSLSKAFVLSLYIYVTADQRSEWENYTATHNSWVQDSIIHTQTTTTTTTTTTNGAISYNNKNNNDSSLSSSSSSVHDLPPMYNVIYGSDEYTKLPETINNTSTVGSSSTSTTNRTTPLYYYYLPRWQINPVIRTESPYNLNLLSGSISSVPCVYSALQSQTVTISEAVNVPLSRNDTTRVQMVSEWIAPYVKHGIDPAEPVSDIFYPIINQLHSIRTPPPPPPPPLYSKNNATSYTTATTTNFSMNNNASTTTSTSPFQQLPILPPNDKFVGFIAASIFWRDLLTNILSSDELGLVIVFDNPCHPSFTYEINGPDVVFLGLGDLHDRTFNSLVQSFLLVDVTRYASTSKSTSPYSGLPVNPEYCPFTIRMYPTIETEQAVLSNKPLAFMMATVAIFAFTSALFFVYNYWVERQQRQTMICAIRSSINANELDKIVQNRTLTLQHTNARLAEANNKIQRTSELQLEHFACMSHEIRTPLNGINGLSGLVYDDMKRLMNTIDKNDSSIDVETTKNIISASFESMQMIVSSGELLRTIVDDVLDFAKLGSGKVEIDIQPNISLQQVLDTVLASILSVEAVNSKRLTIRTIYGTNVPPYIATDSRRVQQILYNLLGNAVKFSRAEGIIELKVFYVEGTMIPNDENTTTMNDNNNTQHSTRSMTAPIPRLRFIVKDYGKGIPQEKFQAIFEPFIQAEGAKTEMKHGGTGLGLAITSRLVDALGGSIQVDSSVGEWTEFCVDLLLVQQPDSGTGTTTTTTPPSPPTILSSPPAILQKAKIFLVDDHIHNQQQIADLFNKFKISNQTFHDLKEYESYIASSGISGASKSEIFILIVRKDLYNPEITKTIPENAKIITFFAGNESGDMESDGHFRSLVRILPAVLLENVANYVQNNPNPPKLESQTSYLSATSGGTPDVRKMKILVAEDNKVNQKVLARILHRLDYNNVVIVDDGQQAVEREAAEPFDVVLMDMHMPVLDGMNACKHIVVRDTSNSHPQAKVVFLTAHVSDAFQEQCRAAGAVGFLAKPCNLERIAECLENITRSSNENGINGQ